MLMQEFHSKLVSSKEQSILFEALRRLRLLEDPQRMVTANTDGDGDGDGDGDAMVGWTIWGDASGSASPSSSFAPAGAA
jgi:hypothetical protein